MNKFFSKSVIVAFVALTFGYTFANGGHIAQLRDAEYNQFAITLKDVAKNPELKQLIDNKTDFIAIETNGGKTSVEKEVIAVRNKFSKFVSIKDEAELTTAINTLKENGVAIEDKVETEHGVFTSDLNKHTVVLNTAYGKLPLYTRKF